MREIQYCSDRADKPTILLRWASRPTWKDRDGSSSHVRHPFVRQPSGALVCGAECTSREYSAARHHLRRQRRRRRDPRCSRTCQLRRVCPAGAVADGLSRGEPLLDLHSARSGADAAYCAADSRLCAFIWMADAQRTRRRFRADVHRAADRSLPLPVSAPEGTMGVVAATPAPPECPPASPPAEEIASRRQGDLATDERGWGFC